MLVAVSPARAQHGFIPPEDRTLHERLAAARIVALATIDEVGEGRVRVRDAVAVVGEVEPAFAIKRSPKSPPPWLPGERALLLLSGARSPYRWTDKPVEVAALRIEDAADEARWRRAVTDLAAVADQGLARAELYASWSEGDDEGLRAVALRALLDPRAYYAPADPDAEAFFEARAEAALDDDRSPAARQAAAQVATRHPAGLRVLLEWIADDAEGEDERLAQIALEAGIRIRDAAAERTLARLLMGDDPTLRGLALRLASFSRGPEIEQALAELAVGHPDPQVREDATTALRNVRGRRQARTR